MFCVLCRADNPEKAHYCWKCGGELVTGPPPIKTTASPSATDTLTPTAAAQPNRVPANTNAGDAPIVSAEANTAERTAKKATENPRSSWGENPRSSWGCLGWLVWVGCMGIAKYYGVDNWVMGIMGAIAGIVMIVVGIAKFNEWYNKKRGRS